MNKHICNNYSETRSLLENPYHLVLGQNPPDLRCVAESPPASMLNPSRCQLTLFTAVAVKTNWTLACEHQQTGDKSRTYAGPMGRLNR